mgnify:CR=1 FL=1
MSPLDIDIFFIDSSFLGCVSLIETGSGGIWRLKSGRNFRHVPLPLVHDGIPPCEHITEQWNPTRAEVRDRIGGVDVARNVSCLGIAR